ncbi:LacI family DNA-binding transcriptional regulator [Pseudoduganella buxea]|uniref:LacI family DNA-binding transcriptional regulator n=1 Tax=Pseudoduganella buxea TaxID=1949069 RepID=A0A6I3T484_9BURK|nr:LacI family DNA-binding transcriptional regulator [Pseudoduganella buxea]MTV55292.1 LacI family DNA-binding transcriptional regulator [Pseudoduganella buxea]GGB86291.1 LacI family transcriptional regulator [Pseudoduganella buxea]
MDPVPPLPDQPRITNATLSDVARAAGVSAITVSRALNQPHLVRPGTLAKIQAAVRETGYAKNRAPAEHGTDRSKLVALILPTVANPIFADMVQAASDKLTDAGYQLLLGLASYEVWREEILVETVLSRRPDGIILTGTLHSDNTRRRLQSISIPIVETWDLTPFPIDMLVGFSHEEVGNTVAARMLTKGYRRFAILTADDPRASRRHLGLQAALGRQGIEVVATDVVPTPASLQLGREGCARLLARHPDIELVICSSDTLAQGAMTEAVSRGLRIPDDLAILGFGDLNFAAHTYPPLSSVRVDGSLIGALAAHAIVERLTGVPPAKRMPAVTDTGFQLIERGST